MKKLILTALISGVMTPGGVFAAPPSYHISACPNPDDIKKAEKEHVGEEEFVFNYKGNYWKVELDRRMPPRNLLYGNAELVPNTGVEILCEYDNGETAELLFSGCKDSYK